VAVVVETVLWANVQSKEYNSNNRKIKENIRNWVSIRAVAIPAKVTARMDAQHIT
jgi:hypothetical protein